MIWPQRLAVKTAFANWLVDASTTILRTQKPGLF